ncbi:MAG: hypothetical protein EXR93_07835 [Gemmatimonadetes bacterium]|nr:hypothetical protein [Gemmatimonadota bacterium]
MKLWAALAVLSPLAAPLAAQGVAGHQASANIHLLSYIPMRSVADIEIEQELSRPYAYVSHDQGFVVVDLKDPARARVIYTWKIENPELHQGSSLAPTYLKNRGRYYFFNGFQFNRTGPDGDLGAIVWDVTGLPDTAKIREVARVRVPEFPGGFHETYAYKHSSGRALVITTSESPVARVYDIDGVVSKAPDGGLVGTIPTAWTDSTFMGRTRGYHDFYAGYDPATKRDLFYGAGAGGYYVYDITNLAEPKLVVTLTGMAGVGRGHTFTPDPTGRYAVLETEYTYAPLRMVDLKPGLDGQLKNISRPIGAWTASWKGLPHNHEVRWPYVFVSTYADEFQVFNMMDPANPYTVGYYDTAPGVELRGTSTFGVDVRNADGLIVTSGAGFWAFKMDGFNGWNGHQWGVPNVSSAQDWDNGPDGAPKPQRVS